MLTYGTVFRSAARKAAVVTALTTTLLAGATAAHAYQTANGWTASDYVTGFGHGNDAGPVGLAFDGSGNLLVADTWTAALHKVAPGGGTAAATQIRAGYGDAEGLAFDKNGHLYLARGNQHDVVELNPESGEVMRTVVSGLPCPVGLATDPISGDLFVSNVFCRGGGIDRITGFANGPGVAHRYAGAQDADGLTFAPDGTLYAAAGNKIVRISGTNTGSPGSVSDVAPLPAVDGIAYAPATSQAPDYLVANRNDGEIDRVDFNGTVTPVLTGGSRGDLVTVGPDRCMYADLQDRVIKLGPASGPCSFAPPVQPGIDVLGERSTNRVVDMAVKAAAPKRVKRQSRFTLTLTVANRSKNSAHAVVVTDKLPKGTKLVLARSARGVKCTRHGSTVSCRRSALAGRNWFTIKLRMLAKSRSLYTNSAAVKSHDLDPKPGNNKARTKTRVRRG
jgi:uncharacterized repeat protein (TIGR01451 family)